MPSLRYKAFISYSHADREWGRWLHRYLETYRVPARLVGRETAFGLIPARIQPIFRDRDELPSATDLGAAINAALEESAALIVICSPRAAQSHWVNEELRRFKSLGRADRVFCIIVDGEPGASHRPEGQATECLPKAALYVVTAQGEITRTRAEPVAADARPGGDGKRLAALKLVAGLLGVGFDELRQRDQLRRQRRLLVVTAASLALTVTMGIMAAFAVLQRNEADSQRQRAEIEAATATQTSQFLVSLFSVSDPGESRGKSVTAREILEVGAARIATELEGQPVVQANLLQTMGSVYTGLGLYERATGLLRRSLELRTDAPLERMRTLTSLGAVLKLRAEYGEAERTLREAIAAGQATNPPPQAELARAWAALGNNLISQDRLTEAEQALRESLGFARGMNGNENADVARALSGLGETLLDQGKFDEARNLFKESLAMSRRLLGADHPLVAENLNQLGSLEYLAEHSRAAESYFREVLPLYRRLYGNDHPEVASVLNNLGRVVLEMQRFGDAEALLVEAVAIDRHKRSDTHDDLIYSLNSLGLAQLGLGHTAKAEKLLREALAIAEIRQHPMRGPVLINLADTLCRTGHYRAGLDMSVEASAAVRASFPDDAWRVALADSVGGACLTGLHDYASARKLLMPALPLVEKRWGPKRLPTQDVLRRLVALYDAEGHPEIAAIYSVRLE